MLPLPPGVSPWPWPVPAAVPGALALCTRLLQVVEPLWCQWEGPALPRARVKPIAKPSIGLIGSRGRGFPPSALRERPGPFPGPFQRLIQGVSQGCWTHLHRVLVATAGVQGWERALCLELQGWSLLLTPSLPCQCALSGTWTSSRGCRMLIFELKDGAFSGLYLPQKAMVPHNDVLASPLRGAQHDTSYKTQPSFGFTVHWHFRGMGPSCLWAGACRAGRCCWRWSLCLLHTCKSSSL